MITLTHPHDAQMVILRKRRRFNVIRCGRRFGKTTLAVELLIDDAFREDGVVKNGAINGYRVAYFAPTYKMLNEVWNELLIALAPVITYKNESLKQVRLVTGGAIHMWSFESIESVRGKSYHRAIIDEAAINPSDKLKVGWEQVIRPLLTDYKGDAFFMSTPKGEKHFFKTLSDYEKLNENWISFQMPTSSNPYVDPAEIEDARNTLPPIVFAQEYLAEFTDRASDKLFIFAFDRKRHIPEQPHQYDPRYPVTISVDFNVSPMCAIIAQHDPHFRFIRIIGEYRLMNSDVYELCERIKSDYNPQNIFITGDSSGWSRSAQTRGHKSSFDIIKQELNLNFTRIKTPRGKPQNYVNDKRNLCNAIMRKHPDFSISNAPFLIEDIENVEADETGHMDKGADSTKSHLLDCLTDYLFSMCRDSIKMLHATTYTKL